MCVSDFLYYFFFLIIDLPTLKVTEALEEEQEVRLKLREARALEIKALRAKAIADTQTAQQMAANAQKAALEAETAAMEARDEARSAVQRAQNARREAVARQRAEVPGSKPSHNLVFFFLF